MSDPQRPWHDAQHPATDSQRPWIEEPAMPTKRRTVPCNLCHADVPVFTIGIDAEDAWLHVCDPATLAAALAVDPPPSARAADPGALVAEARHSLAAQDEHCVCADYFLPRLADALEKAGRAKTVLWAAECWRNAHGNGAYIAACDDLVDAVDAYLASKGAPE